MESYVSKIIETAYSKFGIYTVKPYQLLVMQRILEQDRSDSVRNQIVILPTGTGKSLCFQIPAILCSGITVIVYPLLALMNDQKKTLEHANIEYAEFRGGQTRAQRKKQFEKIESGAKIVISNPETLTQPKVMEKLRRYRISVFVCDEAHVISEWGESFRPKYLELTKCIIELNPHQIIAFTATANNETLKLISKVLFKHRPLVVRGDIDRENIFYRSVPCLDKQCELRRIIGECNKPAIVFCNTRYETYLLCMRTLKTNKGLPSKYYHAGLSKKEREEIEEWFMKSTDGVLFATCAYGMGVSKNNVRTVVHYNIPGSVLEYLQESGRAGRDGVDSTAYVLVDSSDSSPVADIFRKEGCRRIGLLEAMGQEKEECTGCDWCCKDTGKPTGQAEMEKIVRMRPFRYNAYELPWILGSQRDFRFIHDGFELDPFFRCLGKMKNQEITRSVEKLVNEGVLGRIDMFGHKGVLYHASDRFCVIIAKVLEMVNGYVKKAGNRVGKVGKT